MKISTELKQAIRAVCDELHSIAQSHEDHRQVEVEKWISTTPKLKRLYAEHAKLEERTRAIESELQEFGLAKWKGDISDADKAAKHGFRYAKLCAPRYTAIIGRVARAEPHELNAILSEIGVKWV